MPDIDWERVRSLVGVDGAPQDRTLLLDLGPAQLAEGQQAELEVSFRGEVPLIARAVWVGDDTWRGPDALLPPWLVAPPGIPSELEYLWERELAMQSVHVETRSSSEWEELSQVVAKTDVFAERLWAVEADCRVRRFFVELDRRTDLNHLSSTSGEAILTVTDLLYQRIVIRATFGNRTSGGVATPHTPTFEFANQKRLDALQVVSRIFTELHQQYLTLDGKDLMSWAFEQFSIDSAAVFHHDPFVHEQLASHGAPDGSEYFKFIELAFACQANGIDAAFWEEHLLGLVRATHSFAEHVDMPAAGSATMGANAFSFRQGRWHSIDRRGALREDYDALLQGTTAPERLAILEDRFTSILAQMLFDTDSGATTVADRPLLYPATLVRLSGEPLVT